MSFHSQNSKIGYWIIIHGCNITIGVSNGKFTKRELVICTFFLYVQGYI